MTQALAQHSACRPQRASCEVVFFVAVVVGLSSGADVPFPHWDVVGILLLRRRKQRSVS